MTIDQIRKHFGSILEAARRTGYNRNSFYHWQKAGKIPVARQLHIEMLTGGKLRADRRA